MVPVLSAFYFGSVAHYRLLARHPRVIIDAGEHYERQSHRTRTAIMGPNGRQDLVVPIVRRPGHKMPMREVAVRYAETWPQQHLHAVRSAYGKAPWTVHFLDDIAGVLMQRHDRLIDLDLATLRLGLKWLGLATAIEVRDEYVERCAGPDLRLRLHPKKPLPPEVPAPIPYPQVFADRHGFMPRMSVIDLVCNCGPEAKRIVRA